jgi:RNA-binding protein
MQIANNPSDATSAPSLTTAARSALRARAHALDPVVMISGKGLTDSVLAEINRSLTSHELIKIRVLGTDRAERDALLSEVCDRTGAQAVQHIGKILVVFRANPEKADEESEKVEPVRRRRVIREEANRKREK